MGKLDSLKIDSSPLAFASFAAKHNALVDLIAGMVGENGISVVMAEKNAIIRGNIAAGNGNANVNFSNVAVVTADGRLQNVLSNTAISNNYPTSLRVVHVASGVYMEMASPGDIPGIRMVGAHTLEVLESDLTQDMSIREIDVCSGNVAMKMLVIASAPYT